MPVGEVDVADESKMAGFVKKEFFALPAAFAESEHYASFLL